MECMSSASPSVQAVGDGVEIGLAVSRQVRFLDSRICGNDGQSGFAVLITTAIYLERRLP